MRLTIPSIFLKLFFLPYLPISAANSCKYEHPAEAYWRRRMTYFFLLHHLKSLSPTHNFGQVLRTPEVLLAHSKVMCGIKDFKLFLRRRCRCRRKFYVCTFEI